MLFLKTFLRKIKIVDCSLFIVKMIPITNDILNIVKKCHQRVPVLSIQIRDRTNEKKKPGFLFDIVLINIGI